MGGTDKTDTVHLGAILATDAHVTARLQDSGTVHVLISDGIDDVALIGSPLAVSNLTAEILTATIRALRGE